jgi:hypothetical protein
MGLIWRGDYAVADLSPQVVYRIMCWEGTDEQLDRNRGRAAHRATIGNFS